MPINFNELKEKYPREDRPDLYTNVLGGSWPDLISNPNYQNTCAIRISITFNRMGLLVPANLGQEDGNHKDQTGKNILIKAKTAEKFLKTLIGNYYWGISKSPNEPFEFNVIPRKTGILLYKADFSDAAGHVDLWNVDRCWHDCPDPDLTQAYEIGLWSIE